MQFLIRVLGYHLVFALAGFGYVLARRKLKLRMPSLRCEARVIKLIPDLRPRTQKTAHDTADTTEASPNVFASSYNMLILIGSIEADDGVVIFSDTFGDLNPASKYPINR